jgi:hypothetical protein
MDHWPWEYYPTGRCACRRHFWRLAAGRLFILELALALVGGQSSDALTCSLRSASMVVFCGGVWPLAVVVMEKVSDLA